MRSENGKNMKRENEDRMSELSDDILTSILSRLTFREAAATSVLSTRWRHLCAYVTHLDFPPFNRQKVYLRLNQNQIHSKFQAHAKSIDHMLDSHKGNRVKEFRVKMHCHFGCVKEGANIDKWLQFAVVKQAEIIALRMNCHYYSLQLHTLLIGSPRPRVLRELSLSGVDVDVSDVLSSFPLLERLSLAAFSKKLRKVSMARAPALKHVAICDAPCLELVEIENMMSLVSLRLSHLGSPLMVRMNNNAPKLVKFSTRDGGGKCSVDQMLAGISPSIRAQLLTLKIRITLYLIIYPTVIPEFQSVKHLELECDGAKLVAENGCNLRRFYGVIQACPALEILELKMLWSKDLKVMEDEKREILVREEEVCRYLKRMKLLGFLGSARELELVFSILLHANSLQEIIVEACDVNDKARGIATARAWRHLLPKIPSSAVLQLI